MSCRFCGEFNCYQVILSGPPVNNLLPSRVVGPGGRWVYTLYEQGGNYPFEITGGHPRMSANSTNMTNRLILNAERGHPTMYVNSSDALAKGVQDGDQLRVFNDMSEARVEARVTPSVRPGQVIMYNGFEPYQFDRWRDTSNVEPGMVKWLHFAGGYGHLRYRALHWQPVPIDRGVRVEMEPCARR